MVSNVSTELHDKTHRTYFILTLLVSDLWCKQYHRVRYPELLPGDLEGPVQNRLTV